MRKTVWLALILILLCTFALSACDNADTPPNNDNGQQTTVENGDNSNSPDDPTVCQHTFGDWNTVKQATCKEEGKQIRTCSKCTETEEESIQKSEIHTPVTDAAVPATCKDTGLTEGSKCNVCGEILTAQTNIPKLPHSYNNGICTVCGDDMSSFLKFMLSDDGTSYVLTGTSGTLPETLTIPETYKGKPVTRIMSDAIRDSSTLKNLILPDSLIFIDTGAILNCTSLESITLPFMSIQTYYGERRLSYLFDSYTLKSLKHVTLSSGKDLGGFAFSNCPSLESVMLPANMESAGMGAFYGCTKLKSISVDPANEYYYVKDNCLISYAGVLAAGCNVSVIPTDESIREIGAYAFAGCNFTEVYISEYVERIGLAAFEGCDKITKLTLPFAGYCRESTTFDHFSYIFGAYYPDQSNCVPKSVKEVIITDSQIYNSAFSYCTDIEKVTFGDGVEIIGDNIFINCNSLKEVVFGKSVKSFENAILRWAPNTLKLTVSEDNPDYYSEHNAVIERATGVLMLGNSSTSIPTDGTVTAIGANAFVGYPLTSLTLPACITSIGDGAFSNSKLVTVTAPGVKSIGNNAFYDCAALTEIKGCTALETIGDSAFEGCVKLVGIPVCDTLVSIGSKAFSQCRLINELPIGSGIESIGDEAFSNCTSVSTVVLPDSLTSIGASAFLNCSSILTAEIGNGVTVIPEKLFSGCSQLSSLSLGNSVNTISANAFGNCSKLTSLALPDSLTTLKSNAFAYSSVAKLSLGAGFDPMSAVQIPRSVTELTVSERNPYITYQNGYIVNNETRTIVWGSDMAILTMTAEDNIRSIGSGAFKNCTRLYVVTLCDGIESIDASAFSGCKSLAEITLPSDLRKIGASAFSGCTSLKSVIIPNTVESIGASAFEGCTSLNRISVPFIGGSRTENRHFGYIFGNSNAYTSGSSVPTSLKTVEITDEITEIVENAFKQCRNIVSITFPDTVRMIGASAFYDCDSLTSIVIPSALTEIADYAFYSCDSLATVTIPGSVEKIGKEAFRYCFKLRTCYIPVSVKEIGNAAFNTSRDITFVYDGTMAQWESITKASDWNENATSRTVKCSDGTLTK